MSIKLNSLKKEFTEIEAGIERIERAASDAGRDLTDEEQSDVDTLFARATTIKPLIEAEASKVESMQSTAAVLAKVNGAPAFHRASSVEDAPELTAGEYLASAFKLQAGLITKDEHFARAAKYMRAQQVVSDTSGIVPAPIVGSLISLYDANRPVFNSFTGQPMPAKGASFTRPRITQHVATGDQSAEFGTLSTQKMTITGDSVSKFTEAGYLDLSQQDIDWTDPAALQLVVQDFADVYSNRMEARACAYLATAASAASAGWTATNVSTITQSVLAGIAAVYASAKRMPDTLWLSLDEYVSLAGTLSSNYERSALEVLKDSLNSAGFTVNIVVGPQLSADTRVVGVSGLIESYENINGLLQVAQPDVLGQRIAYPGYGAFHSVSSGFVRLV